MLIPEIKSSSYVRAHLAEVLDAVVEDNLPFIVTRTDDREPAVILSLSEYTSMCETLYLLGSAENATRLRSAIKGIQKVSKDAS